MEVGIGSQVEAPGDDQVGELLKALQGVQREVRAKADDRFGSPLVVIGRLLVAADDMGNGLQRDRVVHEILPYDYQHWLGVPRSGPVL